jgi:chromosomal replication initiation ATPase DnaA
MSNMREIVKEVSEEYNIPVPLLLGERRLDKYVLPRQDAMWRMRQVLWQDGRKRYSYIMIGQLFNRDHTTVLYSVRRHEKRLEESNAKRAA